jgi:hypothetical protein
MSSSKHDTLTFALLAWSPLLSALVITGYLFLFFAAAFGLAVLIATERRALPASLGAPDATFLGRFVGLVWAPLFVWLGYCVVHHV